MPRTAVQVYLRARPCDAAASAGNPNVSYLPDKKVGACAGQSTPLARGADLALTGRCRLGQSAIAQTVVVSIPKDAKAFAAQGTAGNQYQASHEVEEQHSPACSSTCTSTSTTAIFARARSLCKGRQRAPTARTRTCVSSFSTRSACSQQACTCARTAAQFKFDGVLHEASQEEVFEVSSDAQRSAQWPGGPTGGAAKCRFILLKTRFLHVHAQTVAADVLRSALDGFNGTVMCYGQTGDHRWLCPMTGVGSRREESAVPRRQSSASRAAGVCQWTPSQEQRGRWPSSSRSRSSSSTAAGPCASSWLP